ncbi:MAG: hypothetical protein R3F42_07170 [Pseudomonadota bacterium]
MNHDVCTLRATRGLLAGMLLACAAVALADPTAECRQEVQDYGIPPEQASEYIAGCILSRGGTLESAPAEDAMPVGEMPVEAMPETVPPDDQSGLLPDAQLNDPVTDFEQPAGAVSEGAYVTY